MGEIVVKVVGEAASGSVSLPDDVPLAGLIGALSRHYAPGAWADPVVVAGGRVLDLDASLSAQAVVDGAELHISRRPATPSSRRDDPALAPIPPNGKRSRRGGRLRFFAAGLVVVVAVGVGVVVGRAIALKQSTASSPALREAGAAWVAALPYRGPAWPGVGRRLGRKGKLTVRLEPAGSWRVGGETGRAWIVSAPGGARWGLVAVAFDGRLGYDPTPSGLPFVSGEEPPITGRVLAHSGRAPKLIAGWAAATWGPHGKLTSVVGMGAVGAPRVLAVYRPAAGGLVWRVQVDLSNSAPGAPLGVARKAVPVDRAAVEREKAALESAREALASATSVLAVAVKADPAYPGAVGRAEKALAAAQGQVSGAQAGLVSAESALASARAAEAHLKPASAVGTYDLWVRHGRLIGWAPVGYEGGGQ